MVGNTTIISMHILVSKCRTKPRPLGITLDIDGGLMSFPLFITIVNLIIIMISKLPQYYAQIDRCEKDVELNEITVFGQ